MGTQRIDGIAISIGADTDSLQRDIAAMQDSVRRSMLSIQSSISSVHFDQMAQDAAQAMQKMARDTADWVGRHKVLVGAAVAATAAIWLNNHPGEAQRIWGEVSASVANAADKIKTSAAQAYDAASKSASEFAATAKNAFDQVGQETARVAQEMTDHLSAAGKETATYLVGKGIEGVGDVFISAGRDAATMAVEMKRLSDYSGQSMEILSSLRSVADQTGIGFQSLAGTFETLNRNMIAQDDAAKMARDQMAAWGVSVQDAGGNLRSVQEVYADLADKVRSFSKEGQNAANVVGGLKNILGTIDKNGLDLLNEGAAAVTARLGEAARMAEIFPPKMAEQMNRIKKERDEEEAEDKAWVLREKIIFAELGGSLKAISKDLLWGQKTIGQSIRDTWSVLGDSTGKYIDYLTGKYQSFLQFLDRASKELAKMPGFTWMRSDNDALARAAAAGPGESQVIKALYGRNQDGSPVLGSSHAGTVNPPAALTAPATVTVSGPSAETIEKFRLAAQAKIDELNLKLQELAVKSGMGSNADLDVIKIQIAAKKELTSLEKMAVDAGEKGSKDLLDQAKSLNAEWERQAISLAQMESYWSRWKEWADYARQIADISGVGQAGASSAQRWVELQKVLSSEASQDKKNQAYAIYQGQEDKNIRDQAAEANRLWAQYAALTGSAKERYEYEMKNLEAEKALSELNQAAAATEAEREKWTAKIAVNEEMIRQAKLHQEAGWGGMKSALEDYARMTQDTFTQIKNATTSVFRSMEDSLVNFVMKGKASFSDFANSVISDMLRIMLQKSVTGPLASAAGSALGSFSLGDLFGGSSGSGVSSTPAPSSDYLQSIMRDIGGMGYHGGGIAGSNPTFTRSVDASLFANARRYHGGGLAGDEVPAILRRGEGVFTREQMAALGGGGSPPVVNIVVQDQSGSVQSGQQTGARWDGERWVVGVVLKAARTNLGFRNALGLGGM